jgi:hypothetical protein
LLLLFELQTALLDRSLVRILLDAELLHRSALRGRGPLGDLGVLALWADVLERFRFLVRFREDRVHAGHDKLHLKIVGQVLN